MCMSWKVVPTIWSSLPLTPPGLGKGHLLGFLGSEAKDCCQQESLCLEQAPGSKSACSWGRTASGVWWVDAGDPPAKKGHSSPPARLDSVTLLSVKNSLLCEVISLFSSSKNGQRRKPQRPLTLEGWVGPRRPGRLGPCRALCCVRQHFRPAGTVGTGLNRSAVADRHQAPFSRSCVWIGVSRALSGATPSDTASARTNFDFHSSPRACRTP